MCTESVRECASLAIFAVGALWILCSAAYGRWIVRRAKRVANETIEAAESRALSIEEVAASRSAHLVSTAAGVARRLRGGPDP